jgi:hypothetical protein
MILKDYHLKYRLYLALYKYVLDYIFKVTNLISILFNISNC